MGHGSRKCSYPLPFDQLAPSNARPEIRSRLLERDLENIRFIRRAQELGFSLNEIRDLLVLQSEDLAACSHVPDLLKTKLVAVREKISGLQKLERQLSADLKKCEGSLRRGKHDEHKCCPVLEEISAPIDVRAGR